MKESGITSKSTGRRFQSSIYAVLGFSNKRKIAVRQ